LGKYKTQKQLRFNPIGNLKLEIPGFFISFIIARTSSIHLSPETAQGMQIYIPLQRFFPAKAHSKFSETALSDNHTPYFSKLKSGTTLGGWSGFFLITWTNIKLRE
jgi:hypothetical protein